MLHACVQRTRRVEGEREGHLNKRLAGNFVLTPFGHQRSPHFHLTCLFGDFPASSLDPSLYFSKLPLNRSCMQPRSPAGARIPPSAHLHHSLPHGASTQSPTPATLHHVPRRHRGEAQQQARLSLSPLPTHQAVLFPSLSLHSDLLPWCFGICYV